MKGALLIALAVLIGFVLLRTAPKNTTDITAGGGSGATPTTRPSGSPSSTGGGATSTTAAVAHQPNQVSVLVANGAGVAGLAGRIRGQLNTAGYNTSKAAVNAPSQVATTAIYFQPGYEADGLAVATALSLAASNVFPMPSPTPVPASQLAGVNVLVVAGSDLAGSSSNTTEAPPGQTIAPSPTEASSGSGTTTTLHSTTTVHTATTVHTTTTVRSTTTTR
jgi:LytR cell envelope-related transcriptional attenuator